MSDADLFSQAPGSKPKPATAPVDQAKATVPVMVDYATDTGARWRIEHFESLAVELPLAAFSDHWPTCARLFHELVVQSSSRWWMIVRRLYGIAPLVPPPDANLDDLRVWSRAELCASLGIDGKQLQAELDMLRGVMQGEQRSAPTVPEPAPEEVTQFDEKGEGQMVFSDDDILKRYGYADTMFNVRIRVEKQREGPDGKPYTDISHENRSADLNRLEREWFASRVKQWHRMLDETMTATIARNALFNELQIRRIEYEMMNLSPTADSYDELSKRRKELDKAFMDQIDALEERFPEFGGTGGKVSFRACMYDIIKATVDFRVRKDTRLVDRIHSALEIPILLRQSQQMPVARYRLGQVLFLGEAVGGLFDPDWKSEQKNSVLGKLDRGMREGINKAREDAGEHLVNLEAEGDAGEFPPLIETEEKKT